MSAPNPFKKASRLQARARVALAAPAKGGKTFTMLRLLFLLANSNGRNGRVAVIDSEFGSASKYAGMKPDAWPFDFDVIEMSDFSPIKYQRLIEEAGRQGYAALGIDSLSHAWIGKGGALDQIDASTNKNKFTAWADVTPQQRALVDAIQAAPLDIVATMRVKTEWILEQEEKNGKTVQVPKKVGLGMQQREGMEYEFDMLCRLDIDHVLRIEGSRCPAMDGRSMAKPDAEFFRPFAEWLGEGGALQERSIAEIPPTQTANGNGHNGAVDDFNTRFAAAGDNRLLKIKLLKEELKIGTDAWKSILAKRGVETAKDLGDEQQDVLIANLANKLGVVSVFNGGDDSKSKKASGAVATASAG